MLGLSGPKNLNNFWIHWWKEMNQISKNVFLSWWKFFLKRVFLSPINAWIVFMDRSKSDETLGFSLCLERTNAGQTFKQVSQLCLVKMVFSLCPKITYSAPVNNSKYIVNNVFKTFFSWKQYTFKCLMWNFLLWLRTVKQSYHRVYQLLIAKKGKFQNN